MPNNNQYSKSPKGVLDYAFDWRANSHGRGDSDWLATGESITSYVCTIEEGLTMVSHSQSDGAVVVWLSGGTIGGAYEVSCKITTSAGRTDERTIVIRVMKR